MKQFARRIASSIPLVRTFTHSVPPYYVGGVIENQLGWQLARILLSPRSRYDSRYVVPELNLHFESLRRDGIAVIPDFLSQPKFQAIQEEATTIESEMNFEGLRQNNMIGYMEQACKTVPASQSDSPAWRYLGVDQRVNRLASFVIGKPISTSTRIDFDFYRSTPNATAEANDIDNILHSDLHLDTVKVFYTLSDITLKNGPFVFAKGSHRQSWARLRHEYQKSIDNAHLRKQKWNRIPPSRLTSRGPMKRVKMSDDDRARLGIVETPFIAPAGSLIVANTFGFHRRGEFAPNQTRRWIQLGYRSYNRGIS